jgi:hypothetical protein
MAGMAGPNEFMAAVAQLGNVQFNGKTANQQIAAGRQGRCASEQI